MRAKWFRRLVNLWPPLRFAGIRVTHMSDDYRCTRVLLKLRWYNRNYVGTQFGGSMFAMTDPWYMVMLIKNLGPDYYVWDKKGDIDFIAPGETAVTASFQIDDAVLDEIRARTAGGDKYLKTFTIDIHDTRGQLVARAHRTVYIKLKPHKRPQDEVES